MQFVQTFVKPSHIKGAGQGLFALEDIFKGQLISVTDTCKLDIVFEDEYQKQCEKGNPRALRTGIRYHADLFAYYHDIHRADRFIDTDFLNHSFEPNVLWALGSFFALKDIKNGDELTLDYRVWLPNRDSFGKVKFFFTDSTTGQLVGGFENKEAVTYTLRMLQNL